MKELQHPVNSEATDLRFPLLLDRNRQRDARRRDHAPSRLPAPRRSSLDFNPIDRLMMMDSNDDGERVVNAEGIRDLLTSESNSSSSTRRRIGSSENQGTDRAVPNINDDSSEEQETKEDPHYMSNHDSPKK